MKKIVCLIVSAALALSLSACTDKEEVNTAKSAELKAQYSFYENSVKKMCNKMDVTPEQADEIFIILTNCGMHQDINYILGSSGKYTVDVGKVGEGVTNYYITIENGVVTEIKEGLKIVYPEIDSSDSSETQEPSSEPETSEIESSAPSVPESTQTESSSTVTAPPQSSSTTTPSTLQPKPSVVYIAASGNGSKYHKSSKCSGMNGDVIEMTREEAEAAGYSPCKKNSCYG